MAGNLRSRVLKCLYAGRAVNITGDAEIGSHRDGIRLSCVINFYGRLDLLRGILFSLVQQSLNPSLFEVVLVEDNNGTPEGAALADDFSSMLPVVYAPLLCNYGRMGYSRNLGVELSRGEIILFLDDDTVILQPDFLSILLEQFDAHGDVDAIVPFGQASFSLIKGKYSFHEPYFMTSRCTAYRRTVLAALGGFMSDFVGQEDVEFVIRFLLAGRKSLNVSNLAYFHPPLTVGNLRKPMAVGLSFYGLRQRYPFLLWLLVLINCSRHAPLYLFPGRKNREMGRFGIGFLLGVMNGLRGGRSASYS